MAPLTPSVPLADCALTFDDGPDPQWTPRVLAALARGGVRATFFMIGERAQAHPGLVARVLERGHAVELHCHRHIRHTELNRGELCADARNALTVLRRAGAQPRLWRPPWGVCTADTRAVARALGLRLTFWDADTHDWRGDSATEMDARLRGRLRPGSVVLMHDGIGPGARRADAVETVALVPLLLDTLESLGLRAQSPTGATI